MSPAFGPFISSLIVTLVFGLMWRTYRVRYLAFFGIAFSLWMVRYALMMYTGEFRTLPLSLLPTLAVLRGGFLLWGGYEMSGRRVPALWRSVLLVDLALIPAEALIGSIRILGATNVTHYAIFGLSTVWVGLLLLRGPYQPHPIRILVGASMTVVGTVNVTFPWSSQLPVEVAEMLFVTMHVSQLSIGFGILFLFFSRAESERSALVERLESALRRALSGSLPICAHCKAIRDEQGSWEPLERYIGHRTGTDFSHAVCPACVEEHFGDAVIARIVGPPEPAPAPLSLARATAGR